MKSKEKGGREHDRGRQWVVVVRLHSPRSRSKERATDAPSVAKSAPKKGEAVVKNN